MLKEVPVVDLVVGFGAGGDSNEQIDLLVRAWRVLDLEEAVEEVVVRDLSFSFDVLLLEESVESHYVVFYFSQELSGECFVLAR